MKPKHRRLVGLGLGLGALAAAAGLAGLALDDTLTYFHTPSQIAAKQVPPGRNIRIGGLVEAGSLSRLPDGTTLVFTVTDTAERLTVHYRGIPPDLFREGQGVVAEGTLAADGTFRARTLLARHDETYMPPEVKDALDAAHREGTAKPR